MTVNAREDFINYRRAESLKDARHLATLLDKGPLRGRIFIDLKGLDGSPDWLHELERQVAASEAMVSVICPEWAEVRDTDGRRRIDSNHDFVRFELAEAFRRGIPVIPVLVDGARMPRGSELPENLLLLTRPQAELLRAESFDEDADKIARRVQAEITARRVHGWPGGVVAAVAGAAMVAGVGVGSLLPESLGWSRPALTDADAAAKIAQLSAQLAGAKSEADAASRRAVASERAARFEAAGKANGLAVALAAAEKARDFATTRADALEKQSESLQAQVSALTAKLAALTRSPVETRRSVARPLTIAEERALKPEVKFRECHDCPEMVVVPAGSFTMGSDFLKREEPPRVVIIRQPFAVGKFEVTFAEWEACVSDGGCPSNRHPSDNGWGKGRRPVIHVSWNDANEYVTWLSQKTGKTYRLLTEAEWEYVARAGTTSKFGFGDSITKGQAQYSIGSLWTAGSTVEVGKFPANSWGIHDMHGNVWEWCKDNWHPNYEGAPPDASARLSDDEGARVLRGGSWGSNPVSLRSSNRYRQNPDHRYQDVGFRVARSL